MLTVDISEMDAVDETAADEELLDAIGDETTRTILTAAAREPITAKELTEQCDVSAATVYRRISSLVESGLLRERVALEDANGRQKVYETTFERLEVELTDEGFTAVPHDFDSGSYHLIRLLADLPFERLTANFTEDELQLRIGLTDDLVEQFTELWRRMGDRVGRSGR